MEDLSVKAPNHIAILALLNEMARRLNENISKVDLKPLQETLAATRKPESAVSGAKA